MYKKPSRILAVAAAALTLSLGAAYAQMPPPGGPGGPGGPGMHEHFMKELTQVHDRLKLNADQEKQWQAALDTMKRDHEAQRAIHEKMRQQFDAMKQQPILDLNALHAARQQAEQQNVQLREETAQAWLAFYNGLNDQQKTTVSTELKTRFERMEAHREKMRDRWEHRHGPASAPAPGQQ